MSVQVASFYFSGHICKKNGKRFAFRFVCGLLFYNQADLAAWAVHALHEHSLDVGRF